MRPSPVEVWISIASFHRHIEAEGGILVKITEAGKGQFLSRSHGTLRMAGEKSILFGAELFQFSHASSNVLQTAPELQSLHV
jgi:hypothetical protein